LDQISDAILLIDNDFELQVIQTEYPALISAPLILLSNNFSPQQLRSYQFRGYRWFDSAISEPELRVLAEDLNHLTWHWFLDDRGNDLSLIDGCSLGAAFVGSIEILLNTLLRYIAGLSKLLNSSHFVYYSRGGESLFLAVLEHLQLRIGFSRVGVGSEETIGGVRFGADGPMIDPTGRKRDLSPSFQSRGWKKVMVSFWLRCFRLPNSKQQKVFFMPAGKHETYFHYVQNADTPEGFLWILPALHWMNLVTRKKRLSFYSISAKKPSRNQTKKIERVLKSLRENIRKRVIAIDAELFIYALERYTFAYFPKALTYFNSARTEFRSLLPDLAIFGSDGYETFLLAAQAARQENIETAFIPHGIYGYGYSQLKVKGRYQVFNYSFGFGEVDAENFRRGGVDQKQIAITSFPYFERFLPGLAQKNGAHSYQKALCLAPDYLNNVPAESIKSEYEVYKDIADMLADLNIELIGIKTRHQHHFKNRGIKDDFLLLGNRRIPLSYGYKSFPEAAHDADLIIGPPSTALIEAALMGKDYYVYQHTAFHKYSPSLMDALFDFVNASFSAEELKLCIMRRQPYKPGCSVFDLIDIDGCVNREQLFSRFELRIASVISRSNQN